MKDDLEAAVVSAINKVFPDSIFTGCNFHSSHCLWIQLQNICLTVEYKENEQVRLTCRMCTVLAHLPVNKLEEDGIMIRKMFHRMRNEPHHSILSSSG